MTTYRPMDETFEKAVKAIVEGDTPGLESLIKQDPELAPATFTTDDCKTTLLHACTDWPGHFPNVGDSIRMLIAAGANVNARMEGAHQETPLLYAASSNDVVAIDALIDGGADLEMDGSVTDGGTALSAAVNFSNWDAARRLVERGAQTELHTASSLGMLDRVKELFAENHKSTKFVNYSFWMACSRGELEVTKYLLEKGANINWIPDWAAVSPLDEAKEKNQAETIAWLIENGAKSAEEC